MKPLKPWSVLCPEGRWGPLGPYYAMFPIGFVRSTIANFSEPGDGVLDPFCGRGTVPFVAAVTGRSSLGIDVNPVGWVFATAKTSPEPDVAKVTGRIREIAADIRPSDCKPENEFQRWAWSPKVLGFLRAARRGLRWREERADTTLAAIIMVHLHGKAGNAASNQMRQSKAMAPDYSVRWWKTHRMRPPEIDPIDYFTNKVVWRYSKGIPTVRLWSKIVLSDARQELPSWRGSEFRLLLTSPPYAGVTNYRLDNWIRLWLLGEGPLPDWETSQRYADRDDYRCLLANTFGAARKALARDAVILVRTDARTFSRDATAATRRNLWPDHRFFAKVDKPKRSQTRLFGDMDEKPGETDLLMLPPGDNRRPAGFRKVADTAMSSVEAWAPTVQRWEPWFLKRARMRLVT